MKTKLRIIGLTLITPFIVYAADTNLPPRLTIDLRDGSRVVGTSASNYLKFHSALLGELKLNLKDIRSIDCTSTNQAKLTSANGDTLNVSLADSELKILTGFGKADLTAQSIRKLTVSLTDGSRNSLKFNLNNRVEIPNSSQLQFGGGDFTISCWLKTESDRPYFGIISKRINSLGDGWVLQQDHQQLLFYCAGCCAVKSQPINFRDGQWHHILVSRIANQLTFYLDGESVGSGVDNCNHYDNNPIRIGMDGDGDSWHFEGEVSEVHLYNRGLNSTEVGLEWNNGKPTTQVANTSGLIAGYHFDEGQGNIAKDFSGNNHDGRLINSPEWKN